MRAIIASSAAALLLAACASAAGNTYAEQYRALQQDCAARGGVLMPATGPQSSNPAADYPCRLQDVDIRSQDAS